MENYYEGNEYYEDYDFEADLISLTVAEEQAELLESIRQSKNRLSNTSNTRTTLPLNRPTIYEEEEEELHADELDWILEEIESKEDKIERRERLNTLSSLDRFKQHRLQEEVSKQQAIQAEEDAMKADKESRILEDRISRMNNLSKGRTSLQQVQDALSELHTSPVDSFDSEDNTLVGFEEDPTEGLTEALEDTDNNVSTVMVEDLIPKDPYHRDLRISRPKIKEDAIETIEEIINAKPLKPLPVGNSSGKYYKDKNKGKITSNSFVDKKFKVDKDKSLNPLNPTNKKTPILKKHRGSSNSGNLFNDFMKSL